MSWIYLFSAGLFEIGWPIGLKLAQGTERRLFGGFLATASIVISGLLLLLAQKEIPIGTAYAVWTGVGPEGLSSSVYGSLAIRPTSADTSALS